MIAWTDGWIRPGRPGRRLAPILALLVLSRVFVFDATATSVPAAAAAPQVARGKEQKLEQRIAKLERQAEARPESKRLRRKLVDAYLDRAGLLSAGGELVSAILVLEEARFRYPQEPGPLQPLLCALVERCRQTAAEERWSATAGAATRYLELEPENREALLLLARAQFRLARYPATLDALERLIRTPAPWPAEQAAQLRQLIDTVFKRFPQDQRLKRLRRLTREPHE